MKVNDIFVIVIPYGLGFIALLTIIAIIVQSRRIIRVLRNSQTVLSAFRDGTTPNELVRTIRAHVIPLETPDGLKHVLSTPLSSLRRDYAEGEVAHSRAFWFGTLLTGLALIFTFFLIGFVMKSDVSGAIKNDANSSQLSDAVAALGGKFFISATGVAGSVLTLIVANWARARIYRWAETPDAGLQEFFTTVEAVELRARLLEHELLRADREDSERRHGELSGHLASLDERARSLTSIEVSVKDIGNEVSANLKDIMKSAMAEELRSILGDTMVQVSTIAEKVQESLTDSFSASLQTMAAQLQKALEAIQRSIEGQAQGQLDQILMKLQDTVSGGFQSESQKMTKALETFASVVPALEQQLRQMTGKVAEESRVRSEESAQATRMLLERVSTLMDSLSAQQQSNAAAFERMQHATEAGADAAAKRLEMSGANMVSGVLTASRTEIEAIAKQLREAAESSASRYDDVESRVGGAALAVSQAADGLSRSSQTIVEMAHHTSTVLAQAKAGSDAIQAAARDFAVAGNTLHGSMTAINDVVDRVRMQTAEQQQLLNRQREYTREVEKLWPELFDTYLAKFKASSAELGSSWSKLHQDLSSVASNVGGTLAEGAEELTDAVQKLVKATNERRLTT